MSIFICWSGHRSHEIGKAFKKLLVGSLKIDGDTVFISDSIPKGANWFAAIDAELERAKAGVVCLTEENLSAPWLHFEAGALGRRLQLMENPPAETEPQTTGPAPSRRLFTLLHGLSGSQIDGPLSAYQSTVTRQQDVAQLVLALAHALSLPVANQADQKKDSPAIVPHARWIQFSRTLEQLSVPVREVVNLDPLFERKTFNEPIYRCTDQAWVRRYDGARDTLARLSDAEGKVDAACSEHERGVYKMLLNELDGYAMAMQSLLLTPQRFKLVEPCGLEIKPEIRTCCEDRRLAIQSLAMQLMHPLDEPLLDDAVRFMGAETNAERKMIVHRHEGSIRSRRELVFALSQKGSFDRKALTDALRALIEKHTPMQYRASSWDLDRIFYYLLVQYFRTGPLRFPLKPVPDETSELEDKPLDYDWLCAARDVEMEVERYRAKSKGGSLMPLTYALCALQVLDPNQAARSKDVTHTVQAALAFVGRELGDVPDSEARRVIMDIVETMRRPAPGMTAASVGNGNPAVAVPRPKPARRDRHVRAAH